MKHHWDLLTGSDDNAIIKRYRHKGGQSTIYDSISLAEKREIFYDNIIISLHVVSILYERVIHLLNHTLHRVTTKHIKLVKVMIMCITQTLHFFLVHMWAYILSLMLTLSQSSNPQQPHARFYCAMPSSIFLIWV